MYRNPYTVGIMPGDGLIARFGDTVLFIGVIGDDSGPVARLLDAVESAAGSERPGEAVAERVAVLTFGPDPIRATPFAVVAPTVDGLLVLLRGKVSAEFDAADGPRTLSGDKALTWVDEVLPKAVQHVSISARTGSPASSRPHTDLRAGVVPGGGFVLDFADAHRTSVSESIATQEKPPIEAPTNSITPALTAPAAQVAGVLEAADGAVYPLDRDYVIGRDPRRDDAVRNALATAIVVQEDRHISRVHAYISIQDDAVFVRDAATPGGTFITSPGAENWTRIGTMSTELEPGWRLRVGEHILTYRA